MFAVRGKIMKSVRYISAGCVNNQITQCINVTFIGPASLKTGCTENEQLEMDQNVKPWSG